MRGFAHCNRMRRTLMLAGLIWIALGWVTPAFGAGDAQAAQTFLALAILIMAGKLASLVERFGQSAVVGEILIGILLGNLSLLGIGVLESWQADPVVAVIAQLGVVILMFQVGLESNVESLRSVGARALGVAIIGVLVPFALGALMVGPLLLPDRPWIVYLFLGAALSATSVGITARVFRDLRRLASTEARIVLGAAVIDDVLGLIILAIVSGLATEAGLSPGGMLRIVAEAALFLAGAIFLGRVLARHIVRGLAAVNAGEGMKFALVFCLGLLLAWLAHEVGLAPIVGAFAAGLLIEPAYFGDFEEPEIVRTIRPMIAGSDPLIRSKIEPVLDRHSSHHHAHMLEALGHAFVPVFFVYTGMQVRLESLMDSAALLTALGLTVVAVAGKIAAGAAAGRVNKWLVGWGMVPRGEVGLIFAAVGQRLGVVNDAEFSVIVVMVILTTLITPPILAALLKRGA